MTRQVRSRGAASVDRRLLFMCLFGLPVHGACATNPRPHSAPVAAIRESTTTVALHGKSLEVHLAAPAGPGAAEAIVLYASGDGGWFGTAVDMFREIARSGYYAVGISSRALMRIERPRDHTLNPQQLAAEYQAVLGRARGAFGLDAAAPTVFTGWSRGASFAVLAAAESLPPGRPVGVVGIGLSAGEDFEVNGEDDESDDGQGGVEGQRWPFQPYRAIADLGSLPCAVIQARGDQYLSASRARALFGTDAPDRRFYAVDASNHRFSGGRAAFEAALRDALHWVVSHGPNGARRLIG